jgi:predicted secreted Zn-dependent protease
MAGLKLIWEALAAVVADAILEAHERQQRKMDEDELDELAEALGRRMAERQIRERASRGGVN